MSIIICPIHYRSYPKLTIPLCRPVHQGHAALLPSWNVPSTHGHRSPRIESCEIKASHIVIPLYLDHRLALCRTRYAQVYVPTPTKRSCHCKCPNRSWCVGAGRLKAELVSATRHELFRWLRHMHTMWQEARKIDLLYTVYHKWISMWSHDYMWLLCYCATGMPYGCMCPLIQKQCLHCYRSLNERKQEKWCLKCLMICEWINVWWYVQ
jgi:hypothetical protein